MRLAEKPRRKSDGTLIGSAALAAAVPNRVRRHKFPARNDEVLRKKSGLSVVCVAMLVYQINRTRGAFAV